MRSEYPKDIIDLLMACGQTGMRVREIARHVYNRHYGLFAQDVMFERIYSQIRTTFGSNHAKGTRLSSA